MGYGKRNMPIPDGLKITKDGDRYIVYCVKNSDNTFNHHKTRQEYLYSTTVQRDAHKWAHYHGLAELGWRIWLDRPVHEWNGVQQL